MSYSPYDPNDTRNRSDPHSPYFGKPFGFGSAPHYESMQQDQYAHGSGEGFGGLVVVVAIAGAILGFFYGMNGLGRFGAFMGVAVGFGVGAAAGVMLPVVWTIVATPFRLIRRLLGR